MIFLLIGSVIVLELAFRHAPSRRFLDGLIKRAPPAQKPSEPSVEGLMALRRALDLQGKGAHPGGSGAPAAEKHISGRDSRD
jgi:hypothetical protein